MVAYPLRRELAGDDHRAGLHLRLGWGFRRSSGLGVQEKLGAGGLAHLAAPPAFVAGFGSHFRVSGFGIQILDFWVSGLSGGCM